MHFYRLFSKVCEAYEVLSDPKTKQAYDEYGKDGLKSGISKPDFECEPWNFSGDPYALFEGYFGSSNPFVTE